MAVPGAEPDPRGGASVAAEQAATTLDEGWDGEDERLAAAQQVCATNVQLLAGNAFSRKRA